MSVNGRRNLLQPIGSHRIEPLVEKAYGMGRILPELLSQLIFS
jgi:hypothetical protein